MIEFIICDDNKEFNLLLQKKIAKFMDKHKEIECTFHNFTGYGKEFEKVVKEQITFKVYFLDIETKQGSGLDAARVIREKYDDWNSIIIIVTGHEELRYEALSNRLYLFDFINKLNNLDASIEKDLANIVKQYTRNSKHIILEYDHAIHKIELRDIICIEKEIDSKKCIIVTTYGERTVQSSLNDLYKQLDDNFMKVSRSMIVNIKNVRGFDSKTNTIDFINGYESDLVSRDNKKELIERVRNNR